MWGICPADLEGLYWGLWDVVAILAVVLNAFAWYLFLLWRF